MTASRRPGNGTGRTALILTGILLLAFTIRASIFFHGIRGSDAYAYARHAYELATCQYRVQEVGGAFYGYRYGLLLPLAAVFAILGVSDAAAATLPMALGLATVALTYALGVRLVDRQVGLVAALVMAAYPSAIIGASLLGPDSLLPFYLGLGVWLLFRDPGHASGRMPVSAAVAAGLCLGLATLTRQTAILLLPFFLAVAFRRPGNWSRVGAVLLGAGIPGLIVISYYTLATGDPFFELRRALTTLREYDQRNPVPLWYYTQALFGFDRHGLAWYGLIPPLAVVGAIRSWRLHKRAAIWLLLWTLPILLAFELGNRTPLPFHKNLNYLSVLTIPLVLLATLAVHADLRHRDHWRRWLAWCLLAILLLTGPYGAWRVRRVIENDAAPFLAVHAVLQQHPGQPVYLPGTRWPLFLAYFARYDLQEMSRWRDVDEVRYPDEIDSGFVVIHDRYVQADIEGKPWPTGIMPTFLTRPPEAWRIVARHTGIPAYNTVTVYEVPARTPGEDRRPSLGR